MIVVAAARGREVFITNPRVARGIILLERCYPFGETQTSSKTRGGYDSDLSLVCPGIQEQIVFLKQNSAWMVAVVLSEATQKYYASFQNLQNKAIFLKQNLSPQLMHEVWNFQSTTLSKCTINKMSGAARKD